MTGFNVLESLGVDDPDKAKWREYIFRARGRDLKGARFDFASLPRLDFTGADLQGASLDNAQLDRASFDNAQLQSASLTGASLQGAVFLHAQLQGALFQQAQLQGASFFGAQLQGASLASAQLQGASLLFAQLQGSYLRFARSQGADLSFANLDAASLDSAELQGASLWLTRLRAASLVGAQLQGAWLLNAQLQGASLNNANLQAADLTHVFLWRAVGDGARIESVTLPDALWTWQPLWWDEQNRVSDWDESSYMVIRNSLNAIENMSLRNEALDRFRRLDCNAFEASVLPCERTPTLKPETPALQGVVDNARVDETSYHKALAVVLEKLVCSGEKDSIYVLRGLLRGPSPRLDFTGSEATALADHIMTKDCLVSPLLTDADRSSLQEVKEGKFFTPGG